MITKMLAKLFAIPAVADWLIARAKRTPYTHITSQDGADVYMYRYWLFNPYPANSSGNRPWWHFPISIRLHHIMREDQDRDLHDHPWNARTFILRGSYWEVRREKRDYWGDGAEWLPVRYFRTEGDTARLKFGEYHRIVRVTEGGVWTLFVTGRYQGTWGFLVNGVKVKWREYLGISEPANDNKKTERGAA